MAEFPFGYTVKPGDTTSLGLMSDRPRLSWPADPDRLYTVMFFDHDSQSTIRSDHSLDIKSSFSSFQQSIEHISYYYVFPAGSTPAAPR